MNFKKRIILFLPCIILFQCASLPLDFFKPGPDDIVNRAQEAACRGDAKAFLQFLDSDAILERTIIEYARIRNLSNENWLLQGLKEHRPAMRKAFEDKVVQEISQNPGGPDCQGRTELIFKRDEKARVTIFNPGMEPTVMDLERKADGEWKIVFTSDIVDEIHRQDRAVVEAVQNLQDASCRGDAVEFARYMDTEKIAENTIDYLIKSRNLQDPAEIQSVREMKPMLRQRLDTFISQNVADGGGGADCSTQVELVSRWGGIATIRILNQEGEAQLLELERGEDGLWRVVFFDAIKEAFNRDEDEETE
ncbi:MAG: hypothetical protein KDK23_05155 [Leptospiraceae bacterium]|nr:hypothetical protein [Leptospiraceae bacterium]